MADGVHRLGFQNIQKATRSDFIAAGQSACPLSPGKDRAKVRLYSRPGNDLTYRFPVIVETVARLP
jgi:hypothetical protein